MSTRSKAKGTPRKRPARQTAETSVSIRLPKATIALIETWRKTWHYRSRSEVVRVMLALGINAATAQMA